MNYQQIVDGLDQIINEWDSDCNFWACDGWNYRDVRGILRIRKRPQSMITCGNCQSIMEVNQLADKIARKHQCSRHLEPTVTYWPDWQRNSGLNKQYFK